MIIDEKNISEEVQWHAESLANRVIKALKKNCFDAEYVTNRHEALARVLELIPSKGTIGCGESVTLDQIGFNDWLMVQKEHEVFSHRLRQPSDFSSPDLHRDWCFEIHRKALTSDAFVTGTNAITLEGKLVNMDGDGNRVAAMIYGPKRVIIIAGINKIVRDVDEAIRRIHEYTAPINNRRHVVKHNFDIVSKLPCVLTGTCNHCRSDNRSCHITTIIDGWSPGAKGSAQLPPYVIIVGETLGI